MNKIKAFRFLGSISLLLLTLCLTSTSYAQTLYGSLTGAVTDSTGSVVSGAKVTVTNPATGLTRSDTTDASGSYQFTDLPPGTYNVTFIASSFGQVTSHDVSIAANQTRRIDTVMTAGTVVQTVEVSTTPSALQTERADVNYEISPTQVQELPTTSTAGRNFQGLYRLIPGVPPPTENNSQAEDRIHRDIRVTPHPVDIYYARGLGTIEEQIVARLSENADNNYNTWTRPLSEIFSLTRK